MQFRPVKRGLGQGVKSRHLRPGEVMVVAVEVWPPEEGGISEVPGFRGCPSLRGATSRCHTGPEDLI